MATEIEVYKKNTAEITCNLSGLDSWSGYTPYLTIRETVHSSENIIEATGSISGGVATFTVSKTQNNITAKEYVFDVSIEDGTNIFTVDLGTNEPIGTYRVIETVRY